MQRSLLIGLSLYWRVLVVLLLLSSVILVALQRTSPAADLTFIKLKPTFLYALYGVVWLASLFALPNGIVHLVWGKRLSLPVRFWREFTAVFAVLFFALALANLVAVYLLTVESWVQFKFFVPSVTVLVATLVAAVVLSKRNVTVDHERVA